MTQQYRLVQWNRQKKVYDLILAAGIVLMIAAFFVVGVIRHPGDTAMSPPVLIIRALGTTAIVLMHIVLLIGPLARLRPRMAAILYNRRHLGVAMFAVALLHGLAVIGFYGGFGNRDPLTAVLASTSARPPFELFGAIALAVLFVMAATSHDFWLANLGPKVWKSIHVGVYFAWVMTIAHVALGVLQSEPSQIPPILMGIGVALVTGTHTAAAIAQRRRERSEDAPITDDWIDAGPATDLPNDGGAVTIRPPGGAAAIALVRDGDAVHAVANQCAHQGGPLGEGRIVDGCLTCPWHGYQYRPGDGCSPPPYTEKLPTYEVRISAGRVLIDPEPKAPGTMVTPARLEGTAPEGGDA